MDFKFKDQDVAEGTQLSVNVKTEWWLRYTVPEALADEYVDAGDQMEWSTDEAKMLSARDWAKRSGFKNIRLRKHTRTTTITKEVVE
jgi:hypothetical protein